MVSSIFLSSDLISVLSAGEYEDEVDLNSGWATGDWNGDTEFDSTDFVVAFTAGGYEDGPRMEAQAVPEPSSLVVLLIGLVCVLGRFRTRKAC